MDFTAKIPRAGNGEIDEALFPIARVFHKLKASVRRLCVERLFMKKPRYSGR